MKLFLAFILLHGFGYSPFWYLLAVVLQGFLLIVEYEANK